MKSRTLMLLGAGLVIIVAGVLASLSLAGAKTPRSGVTLNLVAYSTPREAYNLIIPAFQKTKAGKGVKITPSYGASGDQSRLVASGLPADVVEFSLSPDVDRLVKAGIVAGKWNGNKYHGFVTNSVVVFAVRKGNPKHIKTWSDLLKKGVDVITPNPFTSGGARWNVMAAYGSQIIQHKSQKQATSYLAKLFSHVSVQDKSAREELATFDSGKGDVMLAYENEAIGARQKGEKLDYVVPKQTILIQNPAAETKTSKHQKEAKAFLSFLWTKTGQQLFARKGYRPVRADVAQSFHFPKPAQRFTIGKFGGWTLVQKKFFDPQTGIMAQIERSKGVSTAP